MLKPINYLLNEIAGTVSGEDIAKRIKKSPGYVSQIRAGQQIPTAETLAIIAREFGFEDRLPELLLSAELAKVQSQLKNDKSGKLRKSVIEALEKLYSGAHLEDTPAIKESGRDFNDFPEAFYPLVIVTGDKREERGTHLTRADLGAFTATPADTRWIANLGLRSDVVKHIDKNFLLLDNKELVKQFAETNLLVIGSPAANHLSRIINKSAIFRFNYSQYDEGIIEEILETARGLAGDRLIAYQGEQRHVLAKKMRNFFTGGIFDPTYPDEYIAAKYSQLMSEFQLDFGVLTFAANPYYELKCQSEHRENDHKYVSIMAAGVHHPATAHALKLLGKDCRKEDVFAQHPYGGVIRVLLDLSIDFTMKTILAKCQWEDEADEGRKACKDQKQTLLKELNKIEQKIAKGSLKNLALKKNYAAECCRLIERL